MKKVMMIAAVMGLTALPAVPEPTGGLLLPIGLASVALKRSRRS